MTSTTTYKCDFPGCDETANEEEAFGPYGMWVALERGLPTNEYTQHGARRVRVRTHYCSIEHLATTVEAGL